MFKNNRKPFRLQITYVAIKISDVRVKFLARCSQCH